MDGNSLIYGIEKTADYRTACIITLVLCIGAIIAAVPIMNKKMMACKTCGATMAKSAKKCQACGAKNPKQRIKKLIIMLIIVGIIVGYPAFFIIRDNTSATISCRNGEELRYNELNDIYVDYLRNDDYSDFVSLQEAISVLAFISSLIYFPVSLISLSDT